jgi:hypothetical protein
MVMYVNDKVLVISLLRYEEKLMLHIQMEKGQSVSATVNIHGSRVIIIYSTSDLLAYFPYF